MVQIIGKRILLFTAHPDDESYAVAGTLYKNYKAGGQNMLICASLGENGRSHLNKQITEVQLKKLRKKELDSVCKLLHIKPCKIVGVPDGGVKNNISKVFKSGLDFAKKIKPDFIISFGSDGISGHIDHVEIGKVARRVSKKLDIPFISFTLPPKLINKAQKWLKTRRDSGHYLDKIYYKKPSIRVLINKNMKKRALRLHKSQMDNKDAFTGYPDYAVKELLKAEYFTN